MHFKGICGLKQELNYPFNWFRWHSMTTRASKELTIALTHWKSYDSNLKFVTISNEGNIIVI